MISLHYQPISINRTILNLLMAVVSLAHGDDRSIGTGTHQSPVFVLSGDTLTMTGKITFDALWDNNSPAISLDNAVLSADLDSLTINLQNSGQTGIQLGGSSSANMSGEMAINAVSGLSDNNHGLNIADKATARFHGPLSIQLNDNYDIAVQQLSGSTIFDNKLNINISGQHSIGLLNTAPDDSNVYLNGPTTITASNHAEALANAGGTVYINGPLTINSEDNNAIVINAPEAGSVSTITTRSSTTSALYNPQVLNISGPIELNNANARMLLNLASGSNVRSRLNLSAGQMVLTFHGRDAKFTPLAGSTIANGSKLSLQFVSGGTWQVPLIAGFDNRLSDGSAPLTVQSGGELSLAGNGTLEGLVSETLPEGTQKTYVLVKTEGADASFTYTGIDGLQTTTNTSGYTLTIEQQVADNTGYLLGVLSRDISAPNLNTLPMEHQVADNTRYFLNAMPDPAPQPLLLSYLPHQALPVAMLNLQSARDLLNRLTGPHSAEDYSTSLWAGINSGDKHAGIGYALQISPFISNIKAKDYRLYGLNQQWRVDDYGVAIRLMTLLPGKRFGAGLAVGHRTGHTLALPQQVDGQSDFLSGFVTGEMKLSTIDLQALILYQSSHNHLQQSLTTGQLRVSTDTDLFVSKAGISHTMAVNSGSWTPALNMSWWRNHQTGYSLGVADRLLNVSGGHQHFWQLTPGLEWIGPPMTTRYSTLDWQPYVNLAYSAILKDSAMKMKLKGSVRYPASIPLPMPAQDKNIWQSNLGIKFTHLSINGSINYDLAKSRHVFSQALNANVTWLF